MTHTSCETQNEATVCYAFITHLKNLYCERRFPTFHRTLNEFFGDQLDDENFLAWLPQKFKVRTSKFIKYVQNWRKNQYCETRGRQKLPSETQLNIFNTWRENSIPSTNGRNSRNEVNLSKGEYIKKYDTLQSDLVEMHKKRNKRGKLIISSSRRVATCTVKALQGKLSELNIEISVGTLLNLRPFFISFATEKEMAL